MPISWLIYYRKEEQQDDFMAFFVMVFVSFTISAADIFGQTPSFNAFTIAHDGALRLYDVLSQTQAAQPETAQVEVFEFKDVWMRDTRD